MYVEYWRYPREKTVTAIALKNVAQKIRKLDRTLFWAIFRLKWPALTAVMRFLTLAGTAGALWGAVAAGMFVVTGFSLVDLLVPWVAIAGSWFIAEGVKHLFDRARPYISDTEIAPLIKTPSSSSFPSGHSATAAAGALTLSFAYPVLAPVLIPAGILTALSRIYLGVHYPFDVLAGALIGTTTATVLLVLAGTAT